VRLLASAVLVAALAACSPSDRDTPRILKRAASLRWMPLPETAAAGPRGVYVNSEVPRILIASSPAGAAVSIGGKPAGTTPLEIETRLLLTDVKGEACTLDVKLDGEPADVAGYALRFEAASRYEGVTPDEIPPPLPSRDLWIYLVVKRRP
jgi:hypothetical protein